MDRLPSLRAPWASPAIPSNGGRDNDQNACPAPVSPWLRPYVGRVEQHITRMRHVNGTDPARPRSPGAAGQDAEDQAEAAVRPAAGPPRLTGLGTWVVITLLSVLGGALDSWVSGGPGVLFGLVFLAACVGGGLWVRRQDLSAAPVSAPIAFTLALALTGDSGGGGLSGHAMGVLTGLATETGWLYAGTLCAALIAAVRKVAAVRRERLER